MKLVIMLLGGMVLALVVVLGVKEFDTHQWEELHQRLTLNLRQIDAAKTSGPVVMAPVEMPPSLPRNTKLSQ